MTIAKLEGINPSIGATLKDMLIESAGTATNGIKIVSRSMATISNTIAIAESTTVKALIESKSELLDTYSTLSSQLQTKHNLTSDQVRLWLLS
jgi:hypothetical protein